MGLVLNENEFGFGLDSRGESIWLVQPDAAGPDLIVDQVALGAATAGETYGRWPNGSGDPYPMVSTTLGPANGAPRVGPVVISEVMYHFLEFVELTNPTAAVIDLTSWQIGGYQFPAGTTLGPGETKVVVPFDPVSDSANISAFEDAYDVNMAAHPGRYLGPFTGHLNDDGERVTLLRAVSEGLVVEDEDKKGIDPFFDSLHRRATDLWGNDSTSWVSGTASPGTFLATSLFESVLNHVIGEVGVITGLTHEPQVVELQHTYRNPVIFAQPASFVGVDPVAVRFTNIESDQFMTFLAEPSNLNGQHGVGETVGFVVLEAGAHVLIYGTPLEVGAVNTSKIVGFRVNDEWQPVDFLSPFDRIPVVLNQIQSIRGADYLQSRQRGLGVGGFEVAQEPEENWL